jgi:hypothetical protein
MASNTLLTPTMLTREALRILHQKLNFIGSIDRQYDSRFANSGAKIGDTLNIRLPVQYTTRTGPTLSAQDTTEKQTSLTINNQRGVDFEFSSDELTLDIDDFSSRHLEPAMAVLAAKIEEDALSMYKDVYPAVDRSGSGLRVQEALLARKTLTDNLAPMDNNRCMLLDTQGNVDLVNDGRSLFNPQENISQQYRQGYIGEAAGFKFMENTLMPRHTNGSASSFVTNGSTQTGTTITVDGGSGDFNEGDVITFAGVNAVHPETKQDQGFLQKFVVESTSISGGSGTITVSPEVIASGPYQNVSNAVADNSAVSFATGSADTTHNLALAYHRDAFTFATADLVMPDGVDFASRQVYDGISMRIVRQYDINSDSFPCRVDVLYGYAPIRPQLAARVAHS